MVRNIIFLMIICFLGGCHSQKGIFPKKHPEVHTRMSTSVFLDPVSDGKKTLYVQIRDGALKHDKDLEAKIREGLKAKGYTLVQNPDQARYWLQANLLLLGKSNVTSADRAFNQGFGQVLENQTLDKEGLYCAIADLQISERMGNSLTFKEKRPSRAKSSTLSQGKEITATETIKWKRYQTRVMSTTKAGRLKPKKVEPELSEALAHSITGIF